MIYFVLKNNAEILKCFQAIVFEQNTDKSSEKMPKTSIIYQNLLFIVPLWMTCQKHDFAKAGANISKTWSYAWCRLKKFIKNFSTYNTTPLRVVQLLCLRGMKNASKNWHFMTRHMRPSLYKHFKNVRILHSGANFNHATSDYGSALWYWEFPHPSSNIG